MATFLEPITQGRQSFQQLHLRRGLFTLALIGSLLAAMVIDLATGAANLSPLDVLRLFLVDSSQHDELHQIILVHSFADDVNRRGGGREFGFGWLVDANRTGESVSQSLYLGDFSRGRIWCRIIDHHWLQRGGSLVIRHPIIGFTDGITGLPAHLLSGPTAGDDTANSGVERHCGAVLLPVVAITHVISASPEAMQQIVFWLFGSLLKANMQGVLMTGSVLACSLVICLQQAWRLTALSAGEEQALGLGINVSALRKLAFLLATLLTAASVSLSALSALSVWSPLTSPVCWSAKINAI